MRARQSQTQKQAQLFSKTKVAVACALDPSQYDNGKFWGQVYECVPGDVKNIEKAINLSGLPLDVDYAFPSLDTLKANINTFCSNPKVVLRIIESSKIDPVLRMGMY